MAFVVSYYTSVSLGLQKKNLEFSLFTDEFVCLGVKQIGGVDSPNGGYTNGRVGQYIEKFFSTY